MPLTNFPFDPLLDLAPWVGQRQASFRFDLTNRVSGIKLGEINPIRGATLTHNTGQIIKRQLTIAFGQNDTEEINPITDMIEVFMTFPEGQEYPLGKFVFTDASYQIFTSGQLANMVLNDFMFIVDQQIEQGFSTLGSTTAGFSDGTAVSLAVTKLVANQPITLEIEASPFLSTSSWPAGAMRGTILNDLALVGDYFGPWFNNNGVLRFIRSFNPAREIPDFNWDDGNQVMRSGIVEASNVLTAPNRFVVISNASNDPSSAVFGAADVPVNAPHSIQNRGFVIPEITDLQALTVEQCTAVAENLVQRQTVFETTTLTTAPDPRHDSYNVIHWRGAQWLELAWTMKLVEGNPMSHSLRRAYT